MGLEAELYVEDAVSKPLIPNIFAYSCLGNSSQSDKIKKTYKEKLINLKIFLYC